MWDLGFGVIVWNVSDIETFSMSQPKREVVSVELFLQSMDDLFSSLLDYELDLEWT